jgi:hypothetical protein
MSENNNKQNDNNAKSNAPKASHQTSENESGKVSSKRPFTGQERK